MNTGMKDSPPAFPAEDVNGSLWTGMTLRDYFAARALPGLIVALDAEVSATRTAETAYHMADAMMKVRARGSQS